MQKMTVPYMQDGDERHLLDVYLAPEPAAAPVVVVIHGGGLKALNKERMAGVSQRLADDGFCAVTPNYRLLQHAPFPAQLDDVLAVMEWIGARPYVLAKADCARVGVLGASAGAYLGQMASANLGKGRVRCLVSVSGPHGRRLLDGETRCDDTLGLIASDFPPTLITHSTKDKVVPVQHAEEFRAALEKAGIPHEALIYDHRPETDHAIWVPETRPPVFLPFLEARIHSFLATHLGVQCRGVARQHIRP
jgi:acetyl esterase/lipase